MFYIPLRCWQETLVLSTPVKCTMCMQYRSRAVIRVFTMVFTASPIPARHQIFLRLCGWMARWLHGLADPNPSQAGMGARGGYHWLGPELSLHKCPTDTPITWLSFTGSMAQASAQSDQPRLGWLLARLSLWYNQDAWPYWPCVWATKITVWTSHTHANRFPVTCVQNVL